MTAYAMLGDKDKRIKAGIDNYISKPFNIEELYNIFEFYLGEQSTVLDKEKEIQGWCNCE